MQCSKLRSWRILKCKKRLEYVRLKINWLIPHLHYESFSHMRRLEILVSMFIKHACVVYSCLINNYCLWWINIDRWKYSYCAMIGRALHSAYKSRRGLLSLAQCRDERAIEKTSETILKVRTSYRIRILKRHYESSPEIWCRDCTTSFQNFGSRLRCECLSAPTYYFVYILSLNKLD